MTRGMTTGGLGKTGKSDEFFFSGLPVILAP